MKAARQQTGITQAQRRMLFVARRQLGMDDDPMWRSLIERVAGVRSSTELDQAGFDLVIRQLEAAGFKNTSRDKPFGSRPGFATGPQVALITRLAAEIWGADSAKALSTWLRRFHRVDHLRFVGFAQARAVIEGLKTILARKQKGSGNCGGG